MAGVTSQHNAPSAQPPAAPAAAAADSHRCCLIQYSTIRLPAGPQAAASCPSLLPGPPQPAASCRPPEALTDEAADDCHRQEQADADLEAPRHHDSIEAGARQDLLLRRHDRIDEPLPGGRGAGWRGSGGFQRCIRRRPTAANRLRCRRCRSAHPEAAARLRRRAAHHSERQPLVGSARGLTVTEGDTWRGGAWGRLRGRGV